MNEEIQIQSVYEDIVGKEAISLMRDEVASQESTGKNNDEKRRAVYNAVSPHISSDIKKQFVNAIIAFLVAQLKSWVEEQMKDR